MSGDGFRTVEFLRPSTPYQPGDRATFNAAAADRLVRQRTARIVDADADVAAEGRPAAEQATVRSYRRK